jgi:hypothetical protein
MRASCAAGTLLSVMWQLAPGIDPAPRSCKLGHCKGGLPVCGLPLRRHQTYTAGRTSPAKPGRWIAQPDVLRWSWRFSFRVGISDACASICREHMVQA